MPIIKLNFGVEKPLAEVWPSGPDNSWITEWQFDISAVKGRAGLSQGAGHAYTLVYRTWGKDFESPVQITRFEPLQILETRGRKPIDGNFRSTTQLRSIEAGTHIDLRMVYPLPFGLIGKTLDHPLFH